MDNTTLLALACQPDEININGGVVELHPLTLPDIARIGAKHQDTIKDVLELLGKSATATGFDLAGLLKATPDIIELIKRFPSLSADAISASVHCDAGEAARLPAGIQIALLGAIWRRFQSDMSVASDTLGNPKEVVQNTGQPPSPGVGSGSLQKAIRQAVTPPHAQH